MSLAREIFEKMVRTGQVKGEPEPLSLEMMTPEAGSELPLIQTGGKAKKAKMAPVKIFSKLFNEEIWLVADQEEMEVLASKGIKEAIYQAWEIPVLRGKNKEHLKAVHQTKKLFPGAGLA